MNGPERKLSVLWALARVAAAGAALGGCSSGPPPELSPVYAQMRDAEGFRPLMDGTTLNGWMRVGGDRFRAEDGAIVGRTHRDSENAYLCTLEEFADFELRLEFMVEAPLNSGVQVRSAVRPDRWMKRVTGYQVEIDSTARAWTGGIYEEARRGWLSRPDAIPPELRQLRDGWNELRVECDGPRIRTWLNGEAITDMEDAAATSGIIALQVHGVGPVGEPLEVRWRGIRVRETERRRDEETK